MTVVLATHCLRTSYSGLDRFGRVVDQLWTDYGADPDVTLDEYLYTYDRAGNRTSDVGCDEVAPSRGRK